MFRDGVVVKTVVHRVVVFIDLIKRFCSFVFFGVVFSRGVVLEVKSHHHCIRHKLVVVVVLNSLLTGLIQSSLSLSVYIRARAKEKKLLLLLLKEDTKGGKVYSSSSSSFNSNCVLRCDGVDVFQSFKEISFPPLSDGERVR